MSTVFLKRTLCDGWLADNVYSMAVSEDDFLYEHHEAVEVATDANDQKEAVRGSVCLSKRPDAAVSEWR